MQGNEPISDGAVSDGSRVLPLNTFIMAAVLVMPALASIEVRPSIAQVAVQPSGLLVTSAPVQAASARSLVLRDVS